MSTVMTRNPPAQDDSGVTVTEIDGPVGASAFEGILEAYRHQGFVLGHAEASRDALSRVRLAAADFLRARTLHAAHRALIDALLLEVDAALSAPSDSGATFVGGLGI